LASFVESAFAAFLGSSILTFAETVPFFLASLSIICALLSNSFSFALEAISCPLVLSL
jgi:hypothetical protein